MKLLGSQWHDFLLPVSWKLDFPPRPWLFLSQRLLPTCITLQELCLFLARWTPGVERAGMAWNQGPWVGMGAIFFRFLLFGMKCCDNTKKCVILHSRNVLTYISSLDLMTCGQGKNMGHEAK